MSTDTSSEDRFRSRFRTWLETNVPTDWRERIASGDDLYAVQRRWMRTLNEGGWAAPKWPREHRGLAATLGEQLIMDEEAARADAPPTAAFDLALNHTGATLIAHGTDQQRAHLPLILDGQEIWCQGFSEPNAGSDLASLQTRAVRDGGRYIVNGQKVWSSGADHADWCLLLARTDPEAPKHKGISYFLLDLRTAGIEIRPLRQITGSAEFCEIFLDDVEIPASNLIGREGDGWGISMTTLQTERGAFLLRRAHALQGRMRNLVELASTTTAPDGGILSESSHVRQLLAADHAKVEVLVELCQRVLSKELAFGQAGADASIAKLFDSDVTLGLGEHSLEIVGLPALSDPVTDPTDEATMPWLRDHLRSLSLRIAGGTSEIQRNIVGERVLGLPREPRGRAES